MLTLQVTSARRAIELTEILLQPWIVGAVGALAPEVVRLYKRRRRPKLLRFSRAYFAVSIVYACLGGILATLLASDAAPIGWFYTGAALPFVLDAGIKSQTRRLHPDEDTPEEPDYVEEISVETQTWKDELDDFARTLVD